MTNSRSKHFIAFPWHSSTSHNSWLRPLYRQVTVACCLGYATLFTLETPSITDFPESGSISWVTCPYTGASACIYPWSTELVCCHFFTYFPTRHSQFCQRRHLAKLYRGRVTDPWIPIDAIKKTLSIYIYMCVRNVICFDHATNAYSRLEITKGRVWHFICFRSGRICRMSK